MLADLLFFLGPDRLIFGSDYAIVAVPTTATTTTWYTISSSPSSPSS